ncbi:MAG: SulP family inorganic anion transporter [Pseudomonadota bacterium]
MKNQFAIVDAYRAGLLTVSSLKSNILAGIVVGIVALPLAMAFAIASGAKPEQGLYTSIVAGLIVGIFGGTRVQISGPTGAFVVILSGITAQYGIEGLQIATLIAGAFLLLMSLLRMGVIVRYIPYPVLIGFTSGIGVLIFVGQWKDFFGLPEHIPLSAPFHIKLGLLLNSFSKLDVPTTSLSLLCLAIIVLAPRVRYFKKIPSSLAALLVAVFITLFFNMPNIATIGSVFGNIPQHLPSPEFPHISSLQTVQNLLIPGLTIALLCAIESLLSASVSDSITGTKHNSTMELFGQGLANLIAPLFGGFGSTGAIARTMTNIKNGGSNPIAAVTHSIVLLLIVYILAPYAAHIPFAVLAAILIIVAFNMSDIPGFIYVTCKAPWYDVIVLFVTFGITIFFDLIMAVLVGVCIAALLIFIRFVHISKNDFKTNIRHFWKNKQTQLHIAINENNIICTIECPLIFGISSHIEHQITTLNVAAKMLILSMEHVPFIDVSGIEALRTIITYYRRQGIPVYVCASNARVSKKMARTGLLELIEMQTIYPSISAI